MWESIKSNRATRWLLYLTAALAVVWFISYKWQHWNDDKKVDGASHTAAVAPVSPYHQKEVDQGALCARGSKPHLLLPADGSQSEAVSIPGRCMDDTFPAPAAHRYVAWCSNPGQDPVRLTPGIKQECQALSFTVFPGDPHPLSEVNVTMVPI
jgi:hypothetical protein